MTAARDEARAFLWPAQLGVGVPAGAEVAIHTVRAWLSRQQAAGHRKVLLKLDFRNAFNCLSRRAMLAAIVAHFPTLARFAVWCYARPTCLQFGSNTIPSAGGVQQGDPLGPLFFAVTLQSLARSCGRPLLAWTFPFSTSMTGSLLGMSQLLPPPCATSRSVVLSLALPSICSSASL